MSGAIFPAVLGDAFHELPEPLQELHRGECSSDWQGSATIRRAQNLAGRTVAALFRLPVDDHQTDARVSIEVTRKGETWTRSFGGKQFRSHLSLGTGREAGLVCERFGIITVAMAIRWENRKLRFVRRARRNAGHRVDRRLPGHAAEAGNKRILNSPRATRARLAGCRMLPPR
jgi:hypothetical protein